MLELLAGPFNVRNPAGTSLDIAEALSYPTAIYDDQTSLVSYWYDLSTARGSYAVTQLDGVTYKRALLTRAQNFILDLQSPSNWLMVDALFMRDIYKFDKLRGIRQELILDTGVTADFAQVRCRCKDRYIGVLNNHIQYRPLDMSAAWANEAVLTGGGAGVQAHFSRTKIPSILCVAWKTGEILFYDFINKVQVSGKAFIGANNGAWYSPKHDVYISLTGTASNQISVYANSPKPFALSNPVSAGSIIKGKSVVLSAALTGSNSEPCPNEVIEWALSGPGTLQAAQSTTDAQGVARVRYTAPMSLSADPTFTVTMRF